MGAQTRKITAAFLLVLVLAPISFMFVFQVRQQAIQRRMKEKLEDQLLQVIVLNEDNIHWFKPGKEIVLQDRFFDVKHIEHLPDGNARLTGLYDEEETVLVERLKQTQDEESDNSTQQLVSFFLQIQVLPGDETEAKLFPAIILNLHHCFDDSNLASPFRGIITPPPQA